MLHLCVGSGWTRFRPESSSRLSALPLTEGFVLCLSLTRGGFYPKARPPRLTYLREILEERCACRFLLPSNHPSSDEMKRIGSPCGFSLMIDVSMLETFPRRLWSTEVYKGDRMVRVFPIALFFFSISNSSSPTLVASFVWVTSQKCRSLLASFSWSCPFHSFSPTTVTVDATSSSPFPLFLEKRTR